MHDLPLKRSTFIYLEINAGRETINKVKSFLYKLRLMKHDTLEQVKTRMYYVSVLVRKLTRCSWPEKFIMSPHIHGTCSEEFRIIF